MKPDGLRHSHKLQKITVEAAGGAVPLPLGPPSPPKCGPYLGQQHKPLAIGWLDLVDALTQENGCGLLFGRQYAC
jgi:hypothetical protein